MADADVKTPVAIDVPYRGKSPGAYVPGTEWRIWLRRFENFMTLRKVKDESEKRLMFLDEIGPENYGLLESLLPEKDLEATSYDTLTSKMSERFKPKVLVLSERFRLMKLVQKTDQSLAEFYAEIQNAAKTCEFQKIKTATEARDLFVAMTFLSGVKSDETRKRVMENSEKTSAELLALAEAYERVGQGMADMRHQEGINLVHGNRRHPAREKNMGKPRPHSNVSKAVGKTPHGQKGSSIGPKFLGTCFACGKPGHRSVDCRSKQRTHKIEAESGNNSSYEIFQVKAKGGNPACMVQARVNNQPVEFELDTGSGLTIVGAQIWDKMGRPPLSQKVTRAHTYGGQPLVFKGVWRAEVVWRGQKKDLDVRVMDQTAPALWGRDAIAAFGMNLGPVYAQVQAVHGSQPNQDVAQRVQEVLQKNAEVFKKGLGKCTTARAVLKFKEHDTHPRFHRARPVPLALRAKVEEELDNMVTEGSLKPVDHAEWATPLVVVPKPGGKLRLCGDFKVTVNPVLDINQYPLPKPEDMFHQLNGGVKFSKIDLKNAYTQVELEEDSKKYLVLNTQKGLFQYQRLPFGVASAPAIFQKIMEQTLSGIPGVLCYLDDITITAPSDEEHLIRLQKVLTRMREAGFRLSREKCAFMVDRMEFLGHVVDCDGIRPSPDKVKAMTRMPEPENVKQVESFIGMVNYYGKFIKDLATLAAPLNALRKKDTEFLWGREQRMAFVKIKERLAKADVLVHYDPNVPVVLATDASEYGIGAVIYHKFSDGKEKVIAYASRTLTKAERNYAQIEKEALGIVYGVEKFSTFLYGRKFTLLTDHQPLVRIFGPKTELPVIAMKRIHRWAVKLMMYAFDIEYRRTEEFGNADGLSRLPLKEELPSVAMVRQEDEVTKWAQERLKVMPFSRTELIQETAKDPILKKVLEWAKGGSCLNEKDTELKPYVKKVEEVSLIDGCLMWEGRIIIPTTLRMRVMKLLHQNHYGVTRMKALARLKVWFPEMGEAIQKVAKACEVCAVLGNQMTRTPLHLWETPERVWQRIHIDFCGPVLKSEWLVVVDAKSKWPEVVKMNNITTATTIAKLKILFRTHGVPEQVVSDNGPQLTSREFEEFCRSVNCEHLLTPPYHPNSNGEAERFVQTFKNAVEKGLRGGRNGEEVINTMLLQYRGTPHPATGLSPAQMLMGRNLRTPWEAITSQTEEVDEKLKTQSKYRENAIRNYNKKFRVRQFEIGERVYVRNPKSQGDKWLHGIVTHQLGSNRYEVHYGHGRRQCHADQLKQKVIPWEEVEEWVLRKTQTADSSTTQETKGANRSEPNLAAKKMVEKPKIGIKRELSLEALRRSERVTKVPRRYGAEQ